MAHPLPSGSLKKAKALNTSRSPSTGWNPRASWSYVWISLISIRRSASSARAARGRHLYAPKLVIRPRIDVHVEARLFVKGFGPVHVRDGDYHDFESQIQHEPPLLDDLLVQHDDGPHLL